MDTQSCRAKATGKRYACNVAWKPLLHAGFKPVAILERIRLPACKRGRSCSGWPALPGHAPSHSMLLQQWEVCAQNNACRGSVRRCADRQAGKLWQPKRSVLKLEALNCIQAICHASTRTRNLQDPPGGPTALWSGRRGRRCAACWCGHIVGSCRWQRNIPTGMSTCR